MMKSTMASEWRARFCVVVFALAVLALSASRGWASGHGAAEPSARSAEVSEESASGFRGVKLGEFKIRTSNAVSSRKDGVSFVLHAAVKNDEFKTFDYLYPHRMNKIRDQVVVATRLVPIEDYDDPELRKFRRRILLRLHRTMPELPIDDVYVSEFTLSAETL
jgi:hypothetical protein